MEIKIYTIDKLSKEYREELINLYPFLKGDKSYLFSFYPTDKTFIEVFLKINNELSVLYVNKLIREPMRNPSSLNLKGKSKGMIFKKSVSVEACSASTLNLEEATVCKSVNSSFMANNIEFNMEEYTDFNENGFSNVKNNPLSTFSASVNTASYSELRRIINNRQFGRMISPNFRIDELINYFNYNYDEPTEDIFSTNLKISDCPWNNKNKLLHIGIQTKKKDYSEFEGSNLVFLIDVSGSMCDKNKLPLLQEAFCYLVDNLSEKDMVSIVTYSGKEEILLEAESSNNKEKIMKIINSLRANGYTNGEAGLNMAYEIAEKHFIKGGNNRIIMCSDGDLNVGISSTDSLHRLVMDKKKSGVYLSVLGFGDGNYKDNKMETLANYGNGNYYYIDNLVEARKVLSEKLSSTLVTIADDVKFQVEFNPKFVKEYKLLGYETKKLNVEDFKNDDVDGGDVGYGHSVTAVYELVPADGKDDSIKLKYQKITNKLSNELATVKVRYKNLNTNNYIEFEKVVDESYYLEAGDSYTNFVSAVAAFGMLINESIYLKDFSIDEIISLLLKSELDDFYKAEFLALVYNYKSYLNEQKK